MEAGARLTPEAGASRLARRAAVAYARPDRRNSVGVLVRFVVMWRGPRP